MPDINKRKDSPAKKEILLSALLFFLLMLCVYPSFSNIGKLFLQITSAIFLPSIVSLIVLRIKNGLKIMALALNIFIAFWIVFAIGWEIFLQIRNHIEGVTFNGWIHFFYYDKSMTIGLVWFSIMTIFTLFRMKNKRFKNDINIKDYISFFNSSSRGFIIYYLLLLFYSFVIIRDLGSRPSIPNFIPFHMIIQYIKIHNYETFMVFFGNLLLFTPFGFYTKVIKNKTNFFVILLLPVIISSAIELSQLILKNGNCDIDDVLLNSMGFYLGILVKISIDKIVSRKTCGAEKTVFIWQHYSLFSLRVR